MAGPGLGLVLALRFMASIDFYPVEYSGAIFSLLLLGIGMVHQQA